jgi:hypothetical protein
MADIAQQHLFLTQDLSSVLLCAVVIIMMNNGATGVMAQCGGRHWRAFEITANVVDVLPRMFSLFRKVYFPAALELDLKELAQLTIVTNMCIVGVGQI